MMIRTILVAAAAASISFSLRHAEGAQAPWCEAQVTGTGTASMARSKTATAEAIFWQAIEAFALQARTTSLDPWSRPENVALVRTNRSTFGVGAAISLNCPTS
jgi:hypothetical protein